MTQSEYQRKELVLKIVLYFCNQNANSWYLPCLNKAAILRFGSLLDWHVGCYLDPSGADDRRESECEVSFSAYITSRRRAGRWDTRIIRWCAC